MSKTFAGRIHTGRLVAGGLVAGLVLLAGEIILELAIGAEFQAWLLGLGGAGLGTGAMAAFVGLAFLTGIVLVWLYAAMRPRFGAGPRTAILAGAAVWFLNCLLPAVAMGLYGLVSGPLLAAWIVWPAIQVPAAAIAGARVYREGTKPGTIGDALAVGR